MSFADNDSIARHQLRNFCSYEESRKLSSPISSNFWTAVVQRCCTLLTCWYCMKEVFQYAIWSWFDLETILVDLWSFIWKFVSVSALRVFCWCEAHGAGAWDTQGYREGDWRSGSKGCWPGSKLHQSGTVRFPSQAASTVITKITIQSKIYCH